MYNTITVAIITYNPNVNLLRRNINSFCEEVDAFLIVDNGSGNIREIKELLSSYASSVLIANQQNMGIAKALNIALAWSNARGYKWLMTLDQDSVCEGGYLSHIYSILKIGQVGIVYPVIIDRNSSRIIHENTKTTVRNYVFKLKKRLYSFLMEEFISLPITSGSVVNVGVATGIGGFTDALFIDNVDFDFALRIKYHTKYSIVECKNAILYHNLGTPMLKKLGPFYLTASGHSPVRCYYMNRNSWYIFYRFRRYCLKGAISLIVLSFIAGVKNAIITRQYRVYIKQVINGQIDGLCRRYL